MPALHNPKHERFAQELAKGTPAASCYEVAGFKPNRHNAATLARQQHISTRVSEILDKREVIHAQATADAIKSTALTKEWVIETLKENVAKAMQAASVTDSEGNPIGEFQYQGSVANRALELLGKELGMFIERTQNENVNTNYVVSGDPVGNVEDWEAEHRPKH
jgi:phage terminase small subunit